MRRSNLIDVSDFIPYLNEVVAEGSVLTLPPGLRVPGFDVHRVPSLHTIRRMKDGPTDGGSATVSYDILLREVTGDSPQFGVTGNSSNRLVDTTTVLSLASRALAKSSLLVQLAAAQSQRCLDGDR